jgi:hypothetical protein
LSHCDDRTSYDSVTVFRVKGRPASVVTIDEARAIAAMLPRSYEVVVRGRLEFRIGSIVYVAFSQDGTIVARVLPATGVIQGIDASRRRRCIGLVLVDRSVR